MPQGSDYFADLEAADAIVSITQTMLRVRGIEHPTEDHVQDALDEVMAKLFWNEPINGPTWYAALVELRIRLLLPSKVSTL